MKSLTVQPKTDSNQGIFIYRLVLALIMMVSLSYATFAQPDHYNSGFPAVEFKSFEIDKLTSSVVLKWSVENESAVSHYIIEKSMGDNDYQPAAYMFPHEVQDKINFYQYSEKKKDTGTRISYRIVSVHKDGTTSSTSSKS